MSISNTPQIHRDPAGRISIWGIFLVFLKLGLTSFGGPIAHLSYFRNEFVVQRKWIEEKIYADLVALCQFLPGPASSQVGIAIGLSQGRLPGALAAWAGFTLPSALAMILFAYGVNMLRGFLNAGWLHGLKVVAVAIVAQAVWGMTQTLCPDKARGTLAVFAAIIVLAWPTSLGQVVTIITGGLIGWLLLPAETGIASSALRIAVSRRLALGALVLFFGLLIVLPIMTRLYPYHAIVLMDSFYRSGSLVFGGGHVVLPLLQAAVVPPSWITNDEFLAGYGAAQALPGPLFTFAAYLGAAMRPQPTGWIGGFVCLVAVFLPSFLLIIGALPFWEQLRRQASVQSALRGVNASVVGLLLAALYQPVWTSAIRSPADFGLAILAFALLVFWKMSPWLVVMLTALGGAALGAFA